VLAQERDRLVVQPDAPHARAGLGRAVDHVATQLEDRLADVDVTGVRVSTRPREAENLTAALAAQEHDTEDQAERVG
jgi:hypothetical protein